MPKLSKDTSPLGRLGQLPLPIKALHTQLVAHQPVVKAVPCFRHSLSSYTGCWSMRANVRCAGQEAERFFHPFVDQLGTAGVLLSDVI